MKLKKQRDSFLFAVSLIQTESWHIGGENEVLNEQYNKITILVSLF